MSALDFFEPVVAIINKVIPDKSAAAAATAQLQMLQAQGALSEEMAQLQSVTTAQSDINKIEAANSNLFVAGWRPFVGWILGAAFGAVYLVFPLLAWLAALFDRPTVFPTLDSGTLMTLLMGMLGMGAMRSWDKAKGTGNGH